MDRKIRVGAVSYLNTKPLIYGFEQGMMKDEIELVIDYPANIADALIEGSIDIGLVPVAILPQMKEYHLVGNYGIASDGPVASVCLFSEVPVDKIQIVLLDYQSRTSVQLVNILLKEYWKVDIVFKEATPNFINEIKGTTAAVVIGDRAFKQRKISSFVYDLGEAWKNLTSLPFVFAAWVSNKKLPLTFIQQFDEANEYGLQLINNVLKQNPCNDFDLQAYFGRFIQYRMNNLKRKGLIKFLEMMNEPVKI